MGGLQTPSSELSAMGKGRGFGVGPSQWHRPQLRGEWGISNELLLLCRNYVLKKTEVFCFLGAKKGHNHNKKPTGKPTLAVSLFHTNSYTFCLNASRSGVF